MVCCFDLADKLKKLSFNVCPHYGTHEVFMSKRAYSRVPGLLTIYIGYLGLFRPQISAYWVNPKQNISTAVVWRSFLKGLKLGVY